MLADLLRHGQVGDQLAGMEREREREIAGDVERMVIVNYVCVCVCAGLCMME